jgi:hypothetical protein
MESTGKTGYVDSKEILDRGAILVSTGSMAKTGKTGKTGKTVSRVLQAFAVQRVFVESRGFLDAMAMAAGYRPVGNPVRCSSRRVKKMEMFTGASSPFHRLVE